MGGKQLGFSDYELTTAKKQTKREKFLAEMEVVVPLPALITLIEPYYPKASKKGGRPPYPLATMLRIHLLQQCYPLSDPAMEEALIEVPTMRRLAGIAPTRQLHRAIVSTPQCANSLEWAFNTSASIQVPPIRKAPGRPWAIRCSVRGGSPSARRRCNAAAMAARGCWPRPPRAIAGTWHPSRSGRINGQVPSPTNKPCSTTTGVSEAITRACWNIY